MYYIGLTVHKKTISYCVKDASGRVYAEGSLPAARFDLDRWLKILPQPWTAAMEATVFTGWIYEYASLLRFLWAAWHVGEDMAERVGFEPTVGFLLHTLSKRAP
jgi:hypothetical protein